jgi:hypothetical protein
MIKQMNMPIEQAAQEAANEKKAAQDNSYFEWNASNKAADASKNAAIEVHTPAFDAMALLRAHSDYLKAMFQFGHTNDLTNLSLAQEAFIVAQSTALEQLGVL